ncbi:hypothetical protein ONE63_009338 [Megalurothrips usitatus]|uniref:Probable glycerol kinase n=1 Tax=Megalurothrips usitatus TaxID=439358 RepID=A0AAV7XJB9_9NEOP|nr:hypothetical protein ONE63_009338 [Megalurothrips usitatus]
MCASSHFLGRVGRRRSYGKFGPLVGAIDEGTSSARFLVFAARTAEVLTYHQVSVPSLCPNEGWVEQDPLVLMGAVIECVEKTVENLRHLEIDPNDIVAIGVSNQRETTVVWDVITGKPLYNAIVWLDMRTSETVDHLLSKARNHNPEYLKPLCGLPISTYFSAVKLRWLLDNVKEVQDAVAEGRCLFGTIDTWIIWNLTGGTDGGLHVTEVTNASRTMLMNIKTLDWDDDLISFFDIPKEILPDIHSSSEIYGYVTSGSLKGIPISGCLGDQQAALVGQMCFKKGQAKSTYGTGCFLLYNTGNSVIQSKHGLLTTVAYKLGRNKPAVYALEGSVAVAGAAIKWLQDNLGLFGSMDEIKDFCDYKGHVGDIVFVPAFSGLYAPYWRKDARSVICGLSEDTEKGHLIRAALEAACFQTRDILDAMNADCHIPLSRLLVDGGMTANNYIMQLQADLSGIPVVRPLMTEATALGAAIAAGVAEGVDVWDLDSTVDVPCDIFYPRMNDNEREILHQKWKKAVERSLGWEVDLAEEPSEGMYLFELQVGHGFCFYLITADSHSSMLSTIPAGIFLVSALGLLVLARWRSG